MEGHIEELYGKKYKKKVVKIKKKYRGLKSNIPTLWTI